MFCFTASRVLHVSKDGKSEQSPVYQNRSLLVCYIPFPCPPPCFPADSSSNPQRRLCDGLQVSPCFMPRYLHIGLILSHQWSPGSPMFFAKLLAYRLNIKSQKNKNDEIFLKNKYFRKSFVRFFDRPRKEQEYALSSVPT